MNIAEQRKSNEVPEIVARVLSSRGMSPEEINIFLFTNYELDLHDPFLLLDMEVAVSRIELAYERNERVAIYGDYDIDGITASAVMLETLKSLGISAESYIPDRFEEGYGINMEALRKLKDLNFDLVISVDCGITSKDEAIWAKENDLDLIITDHHNVPAEIPDAIAVINPKRVGDPYPFKELAGVGVAFKLAQALQSRFGRPKQGQEKWLLDLVALGTVCDIVPLIGENRVLARFGLKVMRQTRRAGIRELALVGRAIPSELSSYHLGFVLGPRMNAAGRLEHAARSLELVMTSDVLRARSIAEELDYLNDQRKSDQKRIFESAMVLAEAYIDDPILIVSGEDWSHGVVGIVASKLVEKYHKPVLVAQELGNHIKGSARSVPGFNMVEALRSVGSLLTKFGGHYFAAGYTFPIENINPLRLALNNYAKLNPPDPYADDMIAELILDNLDEINFDFLEALEMLEPFGSENPRPLIRINDLRLVDKVNIGLDKTHLKISVSDKKQHKLACIGFGIAGIYSSLKIGDYIDVIGYLDKNEYNGTCTLQFKIENIIDVSKT